MSRLLAVACLVMLARPLPAAAQTRVTVQGRILDESTGLGVPSATVELEGYGVALTSADGGFRFDAVLPGGYRLLVVAFGYASGSRILSVRDDLSLTVPLEPAPVPLPGVGATFVELKGRVRDPANDILLIDATVLTNQGRAAGTDTHGRFELDGVLEGVPLRMSVSAFGYLTVDTVIVPDPDERYEFELRPDPFVEAMIEVQVERLEERAAPLFAPMFRNLNRDDLLRYAGAHTVRSLIEFRYWTWRNRIRSIVLDGERWSLTKQPLEELFAILPEELERLEFRYCGTRCVHLYVYTRDYMRELIAQGGDLPPVWDPSLGVDPWADPARPQFP